MNMATLILVLIDRLIEEKLKNRDNTEKQD